MSLKSMDIAAYKDEQLLIEVEGPANTNDTSAGEAMSGGEV